MSLILTPISPVHGTVPLPLILVVVSRVLVARLPLELSISVLPVKLVVAVILIEVFDELAV